MMLTFDPFLLLFWIIISSFLPGALLSLSLFKKSEFGTLEKVLIGCGVGLVLPQLVPVLLSSFGVHYSFAVSLVGVFVFYLVAIALFIKEKPFEFKPPELGKMDFVKFARTHTLQIALLLIILLTFWIRFQTYSPVFQELDPYYYTYSPQQLLTLGYNPFSDNTAWYPEATSSHHTMPVLSHMEALWYNLYTLGGQYNNLLLAAISSIYPPIAAALAVFFLYLLFASQYKREYALCGAALASLIPIFIMKTAGGEMEIQPYAFFALPFFLAAYAWLIKQKSLKESLPYVALALIAFIGLKLASSSASVALAALLIFIPLQAVLLYLKGKDEELKLFGMQNLLVTATIYLTYILEFFYGSQTFSLGGLIPPSTTLVIFGLSIFAYVLYLIKQKITDAEMQFYALGGIVLVGLAAFLLTPLNGYISDFVLGTIGIAKFNYALQKTIAEQGTTGSMFQDMLGFMAATPAEVGGQLGLNQAFLQGLISPIIAALMLPFTFLTNIFFSVFAVVLNALFSAGIVYGDKDNSVLMVLIASTLLGVLVSIARMVRTKTLITIALLFAAIVMPPAIVGILKAKYTIYLGFLFAGAFALVLGEGELALLWKQRKSYFKYFLVLLGLLICVAYFLVVANMENQVAKGTVSKDDYASWYSRWFALEQSKSTLAGLPIIVIIGLLVAASGVVLMSMELKIPVNIPLVVLLFGALFVFLQFTHDGLATSLLQQSTKVRFQDNPLALKARLINFCDQERAMGGAGDSVICQAAADPVGYAAKGTNYQYDQTLCALSIYDKPSAPTSQEQVAAGFRCQRVNDYWIESMEWIRYKTEDNSRTTSWWDYGHWINFFGQKNTVLRNEHSSTHMIGEVAHAYIDGTTEELIATMKNYDSKYALFDAELLMSGNSLGGKYGALDYLSCNRDNETSVDNSPGSSKCEFDHLWEQIVVIKNGAEATGCNIAKNKTGMVGYRYDVTADATGKLKGGYAPTYCIGEVTLASGQKMTGTYYLDQKYPNGDLKLNKAFLKVDYENANAAGFTLFYTKDKLWLENGQVVDGYAERKGKFYDSNLYKAFFLKQLDGFQLVFESTGGQVKIYKLIE
jgi:hypothetical protein